MNDSKAKLYARLRVKTGEYESDGKMKNRYSEVGVLFASPHFSNMYLQLETLPINKDWDGRIYVNPIDESNKVVEDRPIKQHEVLEKSQDVLPDDDELEKPIDLSQIPF